MNSRIRTSFVAGTCLVLAGIGLPPRVAAAGPQTGGDGDGDGKKVAASAIADASLAPYQDKLLELAFKAASALPLNPHVKNRSRIQETVVDVCFEMNQPKRALRYVEKIDNWRRGCGYADFAFYSAQHGDRSSEVGRYLDLAKKVAEGHQGEDSQDWERDRIRAKIGRTYLLMGETKQAADAATGLELSEIGQVDVVKAMLSDAAAFDRQIEAMDRLVSVAGFDQMKAALESCAQLFNRFYADAERRERVEAKMKTSWAKLPPQVRIELTMELAGFALDHKDEGKALQLVNEADALLVGTKWLPEAHIPLQARLSGLRFRSGDREKARVEADGEMALFESNRDKIVNIYRAGALRPLAEAYQTMGDTAAALKAYIRTIEEGVGNPNSRPRAEDLVATCVSMASHGVAPDGKLWERITQICDQLGDPW